MKNLTYIFLTFILLFSCSKKDHNIVPQLPIDYTYEFTKHQYSHTHNTNKTIIPYSFFEPAQATISNQNFPLIVSLHGTEYHLTSQDNFLTHFPSNYMATAWIEEVKQQQFPAYVVAPNIYNDLWNLDGYRSWSDEASQDFLGELIDDLISNYQIDTNRIYFVGHSIGGRALWKLSETLKSKTAAIVPLSHALGASENANPIINDISNGVYDDVSVWAIVHLSDVEGSIRTSRPIFTYLKENNYNPVITTTLGSQEFNLTSVQIDAEIDAGKRYFYTENKGTPCEHGGGCHYSWVTQLQGDLIYKWLFRQQKKD